jgi:hypothetical protein
MNDRIPRQPAYSRAAADALTKAARAEHDFPGWLAAALATAAARVGSTYALMAARPGSWEASLVEQLVRGTVGWSDEDLAGYAQPPGTTGSGVDAAAATIISRDLDTVLTALADAEHYRLYHGTAECADCEASADGLCDDHKADLDRADAYRALADQLADEENR